VEASPWLNVYLQFCINTDAVNEILDAVSKKKSLQPWLYKVTTLCGVPLPALMITPVQRIPRYRLLLSDLLRSTESIHPDHAHLQKVVPLIEALASKINHDVEDRQHVTALARLQEEVGDLDTLLKERSISDFHVDSVLSVVREFRHTHPRELAETPPEKFHRIFLLSDVLVSCRKSARVNTQYSVAHIYPLSALFIDENVPPQMKQNSFRLLTPDWVLTLQTVNTSSLEKQNLMTHILSSIRRQRDKQVRCVCVCVCVCVYAACTHVCVCVVYTGVCMLLCLCLLPSLCVCVVLLLLLLLFIFAVSRTCYHEQVCQCSATSSPTGTHTVVNGAAMAFRTDTVSSPTPMVKSTPVSCAMANRWAKES
jgi:RhoGEF domain